MTDQIKLFYSSFISLLHNSHRRFFSFLRVLRSLPDSNIIHVRGDDRISCITRGPTRCNAV